MKYPNVNKFELNDDYLEEIYPNVWLMDDHQWAYYVWELFGFSTPIKTPLSLIHLDFHWDGINDFLEKTDQEKVLEVKNINDIFDLVAKTSLVRKDSFIAPAVIRKIINEIHFYCFQYDNEIGLDEAFLKEFNASQFIHKNLNTIIEQVQQNYFFDLDLDLFNRSDMWANGDLWELSEIYDFIDNCSGLIKNASLITIAMSFGYSGTYEDTRNLTGIIVPKIVEHFSS